MFTWTHSLTASSFGWYENSFVHTLNGFSWQLSFGTGVTNCQINGLEDFGEILYFFNLLLNEFPAESTQKTCALFFVGGPV
jgi:hypothetical protein